MHRKRNVRNEFAVSGVIEALLLVALVAIVMSTIQLVYIPQIMEQREAEHMDEVSNQISNLKSMIELQQITQADAPMFSVITLGSRELPYFVTAPATGQLDVVNSGPWKFNVDYGANEFDLSSIRFTAYNAYFVDQIYALEGGGIICKQPNGESVMRVDPAMYIENKSNVNIYIDFPIFVGIPGKNMTSGFGKCVIRTNYSAGSSSSITDIASLNISTQYPNAWYEAFYSWIGNNVNYNKGTRFVEITRKAKNVNLYIDCYYVHAQISPGWIK